MMLNEDDLKVDVYRASGEGGAGTWAVRLTHLPTGIQVSAEGEFEESGDPESPIREAQGRLRAEIESRVEDA